MFGTRIPHGPFTSALVAAPVGMYFSHTALAYLELDKPKHRGGICVLRGVAQNQKGEVAVEAEGKILVGSKPR